MSYYSFPKYVSVAEKRAKAEKKLKQLKKKNPEIQPVIIEGHTLARTWWGIEWNKNLERYADYRNRIERGRSYVRHSAVIDLQISNGRVDALVQGSESTPYSVSIIIEPIPQKHWNTIKTACKDKMESLQELISGTFPKALSDIFTKQGLGLFPAPKEISFDCSCPDWASMCKHVAATLYGIGARLDIDPNLFFILRNVNSKDLVSEAVMESKNDLLKKANRKTSRVLDTNDGLSDIFGIDLGSDLTAAPIPHVKRPLTRPAKKSRKTEAASEKTTHTSSDVMSRVEEMIQKQKSGIKVSDIIKTTGMDAMKVRNSIVRLKQQGKIESVKWGVYRSVRRTGK